MTELNAPEELHPDSEPEKEPVDPETQAFAWRLFHATPRAYVTKIIIAANVIVFVLMVVAGVSVISPTIDSLLKWGANFGPRTTDGQWWRLFTSMFIHVGIVHIAVNMWALRNIGGFAERLYGNGFYLLCYLVCGLVGSLASVCWNPMIVSAGASGAIFGVCGALLAYVLRQPGSVPKAMLVSIRKSMLVVIALNLFFGFSVPGIDNAAHLGGLSAGFVLGLVLARPLDMEARLRHVLLRLAAGAVLSIAIACAFIPFLPMYIAEWEKAVTWYTSQQKETIESYNRLVQRARAGPTTNKAFADDLEKRCLPRFREMADRMGEVEVPKGTRFAEVRSLLSREALLRQQAISLLIGGLRTQDKAKLERYKATWKQADRMIMDFNSRNR